MRLVPFCSESSASFGIDIEHDRHIARLARLHSLLREAEAIDLLEVSADRRRADIVAGLPGGDARQFVCDLVIDRHDLAELDIDGAALGLEPPRQPTGNVRVEPHRDGATRDDLQRRRFGDLRGAAITGGAAEPVVERYGSERRADHQRDGGAAGERDDQIAAARFADICLLPDHLRGPGRHSGRTRTPGPFTSVTM